MNDAERMADHREKAINAFASRDYDTALHELETARIIYDTTPNTDKDGLRMEWRRIEELVARIETLKDRQSGHGKVKRVPIQRTRNRYQSTDDAFAGYGDC